jgi:hypothetical protein
MSAVPRLFAIWVVLVVTLVANDGAAIGVKVRGGARLHAQARFPRGAPYLEVVGALSDDDDAPLESAWIELRSAGKLSDAKGCPALPVSIAPLDGVLRMQSSKGGEFCLRFPTPPERGSFSLHFPGDSFHGATELTLEFDRARPQRIATRLRFEPPVSVVLLDEAKLTVSAVIDFDPSAHASRAALPILLFDENDREVARDKTSGDGKVRFAIEPAKLGSPGSGKLRARFEGDGELEPASAEQIVSRQTVVSLALASDPAPTDPGGELVVSVAVAAGHGDVDGGVVEAIAAGKSMGTAPVRDGRAAVVVPVDPRAVGSVPLILRYVPASPFFRPGKPLEVRAAIAPPSKLMRSLLIAIVAAAAAWVFASWRRSKKPPEPSRRAFALPPGVHAVEDPRHPGQFSGTVIDAHEGTLLEGVEIVVRAATLAGDGVIARTHSNARGEFAFELAAAARPEGAHIEAQSRTHSKESKSLPSGGTLKVALVTRRRAILDRFVRWARRHGAPYDRSPEPTPAQVRAAASARGDVAQWASEVETAAFGPADIDAAIERRIKDGEPQ